MTYEQVKTIADMKEFNRETERYFFSRETMRFFESRIESGLYKDKTFITSEKNFNGTKRLYTVRQLQQDGSIKKLSNFNQFKTLQDAREWRKD